MYVTVVFLAEDDRSLERALTSLRQQSRRPDRIVVLDRTQKPRLGELIRAFGPDRRLRALGRNVSRVLNESLRTLGPAAEPDAALWFLDSKTLATPSALDRLMGALETQPGVSIVGPKVVSADDEDFLVEYGRTLTRGSLAVALVANELDQGQHDDMREVLAVSRAGFLIRESAFFGLGGFDEGLPSVDRTLDLCLRNRLAAGRVSLSPEARVAAVGGSLRAFRHGRLGPGYRHRRRAQLHRRMTYTSAGLVWLWWLWLVPLGIFRGIGHLILKRPGRIPGEIWATFRVLFSFLAIARARKQFRRNRQLPLASLRPLLMSRARLRQDRGMRADTFRTQALGEGLGFFSQGGAWTVLFFALVGVGIFMPLITASSVGGGGLEPLMANFSLLWSHSLDFVYLDHRLPADPFNLVVAVLGSLFFWNPSLALLWLYFLALPVAALGAWLAASRLTRRSWVRFFAAFIWCLAPPFWVAFFSGSLSGILVHILWAWLAYVLLAPYRTLALTAVASLLMAALLALSPSLVFVLLVVWVLALIGSGRAWLRTCLMPLPSLVLFAPLIWWQGFTHGRWQQLLIDPGPAGVDSSVSPAFRALGLAIKPPDLWWSFQSSGWFIALWLLPLVAWGIMALFSRFCLRALPSLALALAGIVSAFWLPHLKLRVEGDELLGPSPVPSLSLYWLGISGAVLIGVLGFKSLRYTAILAGFGLAVAVLPLGLGIWTGRSPVQSRSEADLPAYVLAEAQQNPALGTLLLEPLASGNLRARLIRGSNGGMQSYSTLLTGVDSPVDSKPLVEAVGVVAGTDGLAQRRVLESLGIEMILLKPHSQTLSEKAQVLESRLVGALNSEANFQSIGQTQQGKLWRLKVFSPFPQVVVGGYNPAWYLPVLIGVFGVVLLLSIPVGFGRDRRAYQIRNWSFDLGEPRPNLSVNRVLSDSSSIEEPGR